MVVTGTDPAGFFVTDLTACRVRESSPTRCGPSVRAHRRARGALHGSPHAEGGR